MNTDVQATFDINQFLNDYGLAVGVGVIFVLVVVYWLVTKIKTDAKIQEAKATQKDKGISLGKDLEYEGEHNGRLNMQAEEGVRVQGDMKLKSGAGGTINITAGQVGSDSREG